MTSLRQRMLEDMQVRRLSPFTQRAYVETVARFARYFDRSPDRLGPEQIRAYQAYQVYLATERGLATSSLLVAVSALRFLYRVTLRKRWSFDDVIPAPKKPQSLPVVLSPQEVVQFLDAVKPAKHHTILTACYAAGPAHLRGHCPHRVRHRQRTDGAAHREGQGSEGPLRDAVAEAARHSAFLVEGPTAPALALSRRTARGADHTQRGPACLSACLKARAPRQGRHAALASPYFRGPPARGRHRPAHHSAPARASESADHLALPAGRDHHGLLDREPAGPAPTAYFPTRPVEVSDTRCRAPPAPWGRSSAATATPSEPRSEPFCPLRSTA